METLTFSGPRECLLEVGEEVGGAGEGGSSVSLSAQGMHV